MRLRNTILAAGAVLAVCATSSLAQSTLGPITTSTPIPSTLTDWTGSLAFAQFNPSLGTLDSVTLEFSSTLTTTLTINNTASSASSGSAKTELQVTVQDAGLNLNVPELDMLSPAFNYVLGPGGFTTSGLLTKSANDGGNNYTAAGVLAEFTGLGSISLPASTFTQTDLSNTGGNTSASQVTDASLTGTVEYFYTPTAVPEPSTLGLLVLGLGMLPFRRRQRQ
jgi:hypothetical protein